jgi:hypothetical protein
MYILLKDLLIYIPDTQKDQFNLKPYKSGNILCHGLLTCKKCSGV